MIYDGCGVLAAREEMSLGTIAGAAHIELPSVLLGVASVEQLSSRGGAGHSELSPMLAEDPAVR